jgi:Cdc6-like AAA superfamily ATPase
VVESLEDYSPLTDDDWIHRSLEIQSLFSPAAPINEVSLIAGRQPQIAALASAIFERGRHAILFGERGVGKTSLATTFYMMYASKTRAIPSIRKAAFPDDTYSSLWRRVFAEMQVSGIRVSENYAGDIGPDDVVREMSNFSLNSYPIIILDEFDKFTDIGAKKLVSHTLKALSDSGSSNATIIIVGVAEDVNVLVEEHASIARNITEIKMPRMSSDEMIQIIDQRYPKVGFELEKRSLDNIISLARGLPEYVHFLGRDAAVNAARLRRLQVGANDVDFAIRNMIKTSEQTSGDVYEKAILSNKKNNLYKQVLLACALAKNDDLGRFIPSDVLLQLESILGRPIKIANFFPHIEAFCAAERGSILEKKGAPKAYKYRFKEPKMQPYVIMKGVADDLIAHDKFGHLASM